ncbi:MAG: fenitrothion hydrolase [Solirubrobacterales bacterium]
MSERVARVALLAGAATLVVALVGGFAFPDPAAAHGLVGRADLPLPQWLLIWGASLLLIGSFAALVLGWREPKLSGDGWRPVLPRLSSVVLSLPAQVVFGLVGVLLLALTIYTGLQGTEAPDRNFSVSFVFVTFWLGMVGLSVFLGDVFRAFNPWRAIGRAVSGGFSLVAGQRAPAPLRYPDWLGRWPAVIGLAGFLWFELVWGQSGFSAAGVTPYDVTIAALVYSGVTFVGMALFGVEHWIRRGETFSVYMGMFASLAPLEVRDGRIGLRKPLAGATHWIGAEAGSAALILAAIGGTTFDGAQEGILQDSIASTFQTLSDGALSPILALRLTNTLYLALALVAVVGIFAIGVAGMRTVGKRRSFGELSRLFAHSFIPIALGYLVAHYFSLVAFQEQAQFTYLLSDPLGDGSDIFGTADVAIDYSVIGATAIQWVQFGAVVVGHALALALGHDRALEVSANGKDASWSQAWMLVSTLMFSTLALYLLTQANA